MMAQRNYICQQKPLFFEFSGLNIAVADHKDAPVRSELDVVNKFNAIEADLSYLQLSIIDFY